MTEVLVLHSFADTDDVLLRTTRSLIAGHVDDDRQLCALPVVVRLRDAAVVERMIKQR